MSLNQVVRKKRVIIPCAIVIAYTIIGFWILPGVAENVLTKKLTQILHRQVTVGRISINPYTFSIQADNVSITEDSGAPFISFDHLFMDAGLSSLFLLSPVLTQISLENPSVQIVRKNDGSYNFSDLVNSNSSGPPDNQKISENESRGKLIKFVISNIHLLNGSVTFNDQQVQTTHKIEQLNLSVPLISSRPKDIATPVTVDMDWRLNSAMMSLRVEATPFADNAGSIVKLETSDIDLLHYLPYIPVPPGITVEDGDLNLTLQADYLKQNQEHSLTLQGNITAVNARLSGRQDEELIRFSELSVDLAPSQILDAEIAVSKIHLSNPDIRLSRNEQGELNLLSYLPPKSETQAAETTPGPSNEIPSSSGSKGFSFTLSSGVISQGSIFYKDLSGVKPFETTISPLGLTISQFSVADKVQGQWKFDLKTEKEEALISNGQFEAGPLLVQGDLQVDGLVLNKYAPFYEPYLYFDIDQGLSSFQSRFTIASSDESEPVNFMLDLAELTIHELGLSDRLTRDKMVELPEIKLSGGRFDLENRHLMTGRIEAKEGKILLKRFKDGRINFSPGSRETDAAVSSEPETSDRDDAAWQITLDEFDAGDFTFLYNDQTPQDPVNITLSDISVKAEDLKTFGENPGSIDVKMQVNDHGSIGFKGQVHPADQSADLAVELEKIDIESIQPYFTETIKIIVTSGNISTKGRLALNMGEGPLPAVRFAGQASVTDFVSLDKNSAKDFFRCKSFYLSDADVSASPVSVSIKEISLTDFYSTIAVDDTGRLNISDIFSKGPDTQKSDQSENGISETVEHSHHIQVENVTVAAGNISFSDYFTKPNFMAEMKDISGSVIGLSSRQDARAKLHLKGTHGASSPLDIVGLTNMLAPRKMADIEISFKDIELSNFTPYSAKYLGYEIEKGKLILDLDYKIDGNKLSSQNKVRFDNFDLGDQVDSEHATSLPVGLAISLLKNSDGQINLDLPVEGELDDPEFEIGSIIFKMLANLIMKVVTSPFSVIGSMFGGGEDLGYAEYDYGQSDLNITDTEKLDTLARILTEKPDIKLEIQGGYHPLKDRQSLQEAAYEELLKEKKFKYLADKGETSVDLEHIVVLEEEKPLFIETAYELAQFPKPRDEQGNEKLLETEDKKNLLITNMDVGTDELRILGLKRSRTIKEYLISDGGISKERIFLLEPQGSQETYENNKVRLIFNLK